MIQTRILFFFCVLTLVSAVKAQSFYEKMMEQSIANADTSNDWTIVERSVYTMQRVSKGVSNNWAPAYYSALCYIRSSGLLLIKKDTSMAKLRSRMALAHLKTYDSIKPNDQESKLLSLYQKVNQLRTTRANKKDIVLMETQLEDFRKGNSSNPRIYVLQAYYYHCFYNTTKDKRKKAIELLKESEKLFDQEKPNGYDPKWGKKWAGEISAQLTKIN